MPEHKSSESILKELSTIMDIIGKVESIEKLPSIEREIVLSKLRDVYEKLSNVSYHKAATGDQEDPEPEAIIPEQKDGLADTLELEETEEEVIHYEMEEQLHHQPSDEIPDEPVSDQPEEEIPEEAVEDTEVKTEEVPSGQAEKVQETMKETQSDKGRKSQPGIIAEKLTGDRQVVYDTLAENSSHNNISTKLQSKPITNIAAVIGINDKFQLIRDLFNGDSGNFNKTLEILNGATNFNEAFAYINENFDWDMEDPSVQFILDLVRRKFITNKDV